MKKSKIILVKNYSREAVAMKNIYISKLEKFCRDHLVIIEPLDLYKHHKKIKQECLNNFNEIFKKIGDEEFQQNYNLQRKRLEIELDNVFIDVYDQNKKDILPL